MDGIRLTFGLMFARVNTLSMIIDQYEHFYTKKQLAAIALDKVIMYLVYNHARVINV